MVDLSTIQKSLAAGQLSEAEAACRRVLHSSPRDPAANHLLGLILHQQGLVEDGCRLLEHAISLDPGVARFHLNFAGILGSMGQHELALEHSKTAVELEPNSGLAHHNLGVALEAMGKLDDAIAAYRRAIALMPDYAPGHSHLGNALRQQGRIDDALAAHRRGVSLGPTNPDAILQLAGTLWESGDQRELIACYRQAMSLRPNSAIHSNLIFAMQHDPACSPAEKLREAIAWNQRHNSPLGSTVHSHTNDRLPNRKLRIGYVAPDFIDQPGARIIQPILRAHDRTAFEVFCYSGARLPDERSAKIRSLAGAWRHIGRASDDDAAKLVRNDRIDILVDLCGHMGGTRLPLFALRPAPIQIQLAYPGTTGLTAMDYRISDTYSDPPAIGEAQHVEQLIRLPIAWPYDPGELPPVGLLPALTHGRVTFGCLNRPLKITEQAIALWARILKAIPRSRLVLLSGSTDGRNGRLEPLLAAQGIRDHQVRLVPRMPREQFLALFISIDIALDPFPYSGEATTLDGLWMGVPLITLAGDSCVSRRGVSHLSALGLQDLIAGSEDDYVTRAIGMASDLPRLSRLRQTLRDRLGASLLGDGAAYTRHFEAALRTAWQGMV